MKLVIFITLATLLLSGKPSNSQDIETVFPLKWKVKTGLSTYRSNIIFDNNKIYIGSNGVDRNKNNDSLDGVFIIQAESGKILHHIQAPILGDNDVNGVLVNSGKLYFGSDNYHFYCYTEEGKKIWEYATEYDVESCPVLVNISNDETPDIVFTVEGKGLVALDGKTGRELWKFHTDFSRGFNGTPAVYDINQDGQEDLLIGGEGIPSTNETESWKRVSYGDHFYAINGKDGSVLWKYEVGSKIHSSPLVTRHNDEIEIIVTESYGLVYVFDCTGKIKKVLGAGIGLFGSPVLSDNGEFLCMGHSWHSNINSIGCYPFGDEMFVPNSKGIKELSDQGYKNIIKQNAKKTSATALYADIIGNGEMQWIITDEKGNLFILEKSGKPIQKMQFPKGAEATPLIHDIDNDGKLEILISALDGYLYCYDTDSSGKVHWGQFRGDNRNSGTMTIK